MDALEVLQKIQELKEIYGDIEVMVKSNSEGNEFFKKIIDVDLQAGMIDEEGEFIDERVILIICE
ncbi:hypothetical protein P6Y11_13020 [Enterococcus faecalis]|uniref:Uncharacterized protein n=1 Tax=Enterococcus faecalis TaxID=1351 RepID=A0AAW7KN57_ENTFL|nr:MULTISPECIES: hypothetical protein [Bacteria]AUC57691.1 hypothetical protein CG806_04720 [Enterococcus faecalis ARO1/DG]EEU87341.1 predicted protein [Enterococcus faecalis ARO1/DG]EFM71408.1 hypothetical protein HMPREF9505_00348 [Enterococcus faecalis TX0109]EGO2537586.1 hypothetical protein [Enterococcus faecalis]EGO2560561.1 hypothetical protein [Enterococcus faecalis]